MNIKASVLALIIITLLLGACAPAAPQPTATPLPSPTATASASPTASITPSPAPTSTATAEPTQTPAATATEEAAELTMPQGVPLAEWSGTPVMPGAIAGEEDDGSYRFSIKASAEEVQAYYEKELQKLGWEMLGSGEGTTGTLMLIFMKGTESFSIAVIPSKQDASIVQVLMVN